MEHIFDWQLLRTEVFIGLHYQWIKWFPLENELGFFKISVAEEIQYIHITLCYSLILRFQEQVIYVITVQVFPLNSHPSHHTAVSILVITTLTLIFLRLACVKEELILYIHSNN